MSLNQPQLNAIIRAACLVVPTVTTVGSLGYLGAGILSASDYTFNFLHSNAVLDTRGFTALNSGGPSVPTLDANGLPTGASTLCLNTMPSTSSPGPLPPGNYFLNVKSTGGAVATTVSSAGVAGAMTLGTGVLQGDGVTMRYPLTINSGFAGTIAVNFSGPLLDFPDVARDGSTSSVGQPLFYAPAVAYYAQFSCLRLMDFLATNTRQDTTWSTRPGAWAMHAYGAPYSWEKMVLFINAVANYQGSQLKNVFINIPGYADSTYVSSLSALLTSLGLTNAIQLNVQRANEHWNSAFTFYNSYISAGMTELQYLSNYVPQGLTATIASVVSDGTKLTFTTVSPIGSYLTTTANCVVVGGAGGFSVGTVASPVVATKTGASTFTVPTTSTYNGTGNMGVFFNLASTLITDGVPPDVYHVGSKWHVRLTYQDQQAWSAIRPQDRFFIDTALYGGQNAGGSNTQLIEYAYAAYIGGGQASSWLYGAAVGQYITATTASTTVDAVIAEQLSLVSGTVDGQMRAHSYQCRQLGIHMMAYEGGPDLQKTPGLIVAASTDPRMTAVVTGLLDHWFSNGGQHICLYHAAPAAFYNNGNNQGGWPFLQSYTDLTSPKYVALAAYPAKSIRYSNVFGAPGVVDIVNLFQYSVRFTTANGLLGWYESGHVLDVDIAIPVTGSYTFTLKGVSKNANVVTFWIDPTLTGNGTPAGTSTLVATGGGFSVDSAANAVNVNDPITLQLTAGIHTLRLSAATCGNTGAGLLSITGQQN